MNRTRLLEASKDLYSSATRSFRKVILPLAMPGVLAEHAHPDQTSPILRGVLLRQEFLCHV